MDLVKIATVAAGECDRQKVGVLELSRLLKAHALLLSGVILDNPEQIENIGWIVEPNKNVNGFRKTPVTFQNGGSSAPESEIPRLMRRLMEGFENDSKSKVDIDLCVMEFLWIHPFADGNGRVGWLLYNYLNKTLENPEPLPDFKFQMRIIACGSRDFTANWLVAEVLSELYEEYRFHTLAHGDARGADRRAGAWAEANGIDVLKYRADWQTHGRAAGPIRNRKMLNISRASLVVAFVTKPLIESIGTHDMVTLAENAGLPVHLYSLY